MALAKTDGLPPEVARRVVPGLCRQALEAACMEAIRRRRIGRGEPHAEVEDLLAGITGTKSLAALALFDDKNRAGDVLPRLNKENKASADTFRAVNEGSHEALPGAIARPRPERREARPLDADPRMTPTRPPRRRPAPPRPTRRQNRRPLAPSRRPPGPPSPRARP